MNCPIIGKLSGKLSYYWQTVWWTALLLANCLVNCPIIDKLSGELSYYWETVWWTVLLLTNCLVNCPIIGSHNVHFNQLDSHKTDCWVEFSRRKTSHTYLSFPLYKPWPDRFPFMEQPSNDIWQYILLTYHSWTLLQLNFLTSLVESFFNRLSKHKVFAHPSLL